jgi:hypothetical protein
METKMQVDTIDQLSPVEATEGLTDHELVALITIAALSVDADPVTSYSLRQAMERAGYTNVASVLAIRGLMKKGYIERGSGYDEDGEYSGFIASDDGLDWLENNQDRLKLKQTPPPEHPPEEDDLPF